MAANANAKEWVHSATGLGTIEILLEQRERLSREPHNALWEIAWHFARRTASIDDGVVSHRADRMWKQLSKVMSAPMPGTNGDVATCGGLMRFDFEECCMDRHRLQKSCPGQWTLESVSEMQRDGNFTLSGADLMMKYRFRDTKDDKGSYTSFIDWSRFADNTHVIRIDLHPEDDPSSSYHLTRYYNETIDVSNARRASRFLYIWHYEGAQYLAFNSAWARDEGSSRRTVPDQRPGILMVRIVKPGVFEYASYKNVKDTPPSFHVTRVNTTTLRSCSKKPTNPQVPGVECPTLFHQSEDGFWDAHDDKDGWVEKQHWPELAKAYASLFHVDLLHEQHDPWRYYPGSGWRNCTRQRRVARIALLKWIAWLRKRQLERLVQLALPSRKRSRESDESGTALATQSA